MKFLSRVILSRGKMVIIKKGKRDVWMSQMSLTRSHRPMVLYLKLVFCVGSRESGMWARQRRGSELPAEHSVSPLLCFLCRWAGSSSKENVHQVGQQALDEGRILSCFPSFSYSVCVRTRMFFCMCVGSRTYGSHGIDVWNHSRFIFHFVHWGRAHSYS